HQHIISHIEFHLSPQPQHRANRTRVLTSLLCRLRYTDAICKMLYRERKQFPCSEFVHSSLLACCSALCCLPSEPPPLLHFSRARRVNRRLPRSLGHQRM